MFASMNDVKLSWESITAFGCPVVPAVKSSTAVSSGEPSGKSISSASPSDSNSSNERHPSSGVSLSTARTLAM